MSTWDSMSEVDQQHMRDAGRDEGGRHLPHRVSKDEPGCVWCDLAAEFGGFCGLHGVKP